METREVLTLIIMLIAFGFEGYNLFLAYYPRWRYFLYKEGRLYFKSEPMGFYPAKDIVNDELLKGICDIGHVVNIKTNKVIYVTTKDEVYTKLTNPWQI